MEKHFDIVVTDADISWKRIRAEAALDGINVVRTSLGDSDIRVEEAVSAYKSLSKVERVFRSIKTTSLRKRVFTFTVSELLWNTLRR